MKAIGVLGVGALTEKVVRGLRRGGRRAPIYLIPHNSHQAASLARDFDCEILESNQAVVEAAQVLLLGVRPENLKSLALSVDLGPQHWLVSFMAGVSHRDLLRLFGTDRTIRSMLSYAAETNDATVVLNPSNAKVEKLLSSLGTLLALEHESHFELATVASCVNGWFYFLLHDLQRWVADKGLEPEQSRALILGSLSDCVEYAKANQHRPFAEIGRSITTAETFSSLGLEMIGLHQSNAIWGAACDIVLDALIERHLRAD
ncbi:pyrroline-5-carboxylate reductase [Halopseudomonas litoralis]|uniref:Pyrroline-5-carboxylate reductase n=1 Tax=Halopseudomonas litoralis TaxID=797277 RepID=A0A1H1QGM9_9GAMM|nr:NAD(P)-binding domain-containing protein [Halopseudomonas litoralis]SDS22632.1 pyrroline-5-carboxylate reductase [Halopseudomonas litoralis]